MYNLSIGSFLVRLANMLVLVFTIKSFEVPDSYMVFYIALKLQYDVVFPLIVVRYHHVVLDHSCQFSLKFFNRTFF